jgi:hypothetical protein
VNLRNRLRRLESLAPPAPLPLTREEKLQRIRDLLTYSGSDSATLYRQTRLTELLEKFHRERESRQGSPT